MKRRQLIAVATIAILALLLTAGLTQGQGPGGAVIQPGDQPQAAPDNPLAVEADLGTGFYYQGVLTESGVPVNGTRTMEFKLWNASTGGSQVGSTIIAGVSISQGQFNVKLNYGPDQVDGRALWLGVRAQDSGSVWRDLGRREILSVPYALSLYPGAEVVAATGGALSLETQSSGYPLRAVASNASYDGVWGTGGDEGVYGDTTGTDNDNAGVAGYANATSGSARGGYFYSRSGIGAYVESDGAQALYATSDVHDGVVGVTASAGRSGVFAQSNHLDGFGLYGRNASTGIAAAGFQVNYDHTQASIFWDSAGFFGGRNGVLGHTATSGGHGVAGFCSLTTGACNGVFGRTDAPSGYSGYFVTSAGNGVYVSTPGGKTGLSVNGGTKSAVVPTSQGERLLYTEEASEVWFADYGFAQLVDGAATIAIDPLFAETVNLKVPYHVFLQAYGDAELYVADRTADGFQVLLRDGDPAAGFSYRIVARRLGYENTRLAPAPAPAVEQQINGMP